MIKLMRRAAAKALAEFEDAFDGPAAGPSGGFGRGMGGGFVKAGGAPLAVNMPSQGQVPTGPAGPPRGPAAMGYARVSGFRREGDARD